MESSFQLMIAYDMFYYVKFTALSIKNNLQGSISFSFKDINSLLRSAILVQFLFHSRLIQATIHIRNLPAVCAYLCYSENMPACVAANRQ